MGIGNWRKTTLVGNDVFAREHKKTFKGLFITQPMGKRNDSVVYYNSKKIARVKTLTEAKKIAKRIMRKY